MVETLPRLSELPETPLSSPRGYVVRAAPFGRLWLALGTEGAEPPAAEAGTEWRAAGPDSWLLIADAPAAIAEAGRRLEGFALIDLTHGRERLEISGPGARAKLATGVAVDLSPSAFVAGASCETLFGHVAIHLTRTGPERFELLVGRSLAADLWQALQ